MPSDEVIKIRCSKCGAVARGKIAHLNRLVKCPACKERCEFVKVDEDQKVAVAAEPKTLIEACERDYRNALLLLDNYIEVLIGEGKDMQALTLIVQCSERISQIHDTLQDLYSIIFSYQGILGKFKSKRIEKIGNNLLPTREIYLEHGKLQTSKDEGLPRAEKHLAKAISDELKEAGFYKEHWLLSSVMLSELEYMIYALKILVEPDFIPLEYEVSSLADGKKINRNIPSSVKLAVWRRDNGRCVECGSKEKLEYDHIIPVSKGGSNTERNVQLLCEKCNRQKSNNIQ